MIMKLRNKKEKAMITVEASVVCSLICLFLCGMITLTFRLYGQTESFSCALMLRELPEPGADVIRLEAFIETISEEVRAHAGGV